MRIRWKLLVLLLAFSLLPLSLLTWTRYRSLRRFGHDLGRRARTALIDQAGRQLQQVAVDYAAIFRRETETLELGLRAQAREVERCLAADPPKSPVIFWAEDYDQPTRCPAEMVQSDRYFRVADDGTHQPMPVTYQQMVFKLAPGVKREDVADDVARLSRMLAGYEFIQQGHMDSLYWQYTALASGVHCSYPGHGGYPQDYDPRKRAWYLRALAAGDLVWNPPMVDASTGEVMLTCSMPVHGPDGSTVGVTAFDIRLRDVVQAVNVPSAWSADAQTLLIKLQARPGHQEPGLLILGQQSYLQGARHWDLPIELQWLQCDDQAATRALVEDVRAHRFGLRKLPYKGQDSLWAYAWAKRDSYLLLIVPYEEIIAQAIAAEANVLTQTRRLSQTAGTTVLLLAVLVFFVALFGSQTVTRPISELASAARRIADGDFDARAAVRSRDELGELAATFNAMVPQLADRMRLRQSLALAMEVQQHLLPAGPPKIEGLDIAGRSIYCDETGGDYYDFLELAELGEGRLAVAVGDVTGHGVAAALLMATGRALLRSRAAESGSLAKMMADVNRQLTADSGGDRFMTLVYVVIDARNRTLRWVSAGHDAPITYDPVADRFGELGGAGVPLGVVRDWAYEEYQAQSWPDGQIIAIGTDGIWEARNPADEMFGKEALCEVVRQNAHRSAEEISSAVTEASARFRQTRSQEDDVTLIVIKILPRTEPSSHE
jgi:sigma-B regulation protein RsbU (phosphoserine phosphatase)